MGLFPCPGREGPNLSKAHVFSRKDRTVSQAVPVATFEGQAVLVSTAAAALLCLSLPGALQGPVLGPGGQSLRCLTSARAAQPPAPSERSERGAESGSRDPWGPSSGQAHHGAADPRENQRGAETLTFCPKLFVSGQMELQFPKQTELPARWP